MKYIYKLEGGCGITSINLDINDTTFKMEYHNEWMGNYNNNKKINIIGKIVKNKNNHKILLCEEIDNKLMEEIFEINIYDLNIDNEFNKDSKEYEGMIMGGCEVNINCKYNAILKISNNNLKLTDNIYNVYKIE